MYHGFLSMQSPELSFKEKKMLAEMREASGYVVTKDSAPKIFKIAADISVGMNVGRPLRIILYKEASGIPAATYVGDNTVFLHENMQELMNDRELGCILAHECAHRKHSGQHRWTEWIKRYQEQIAGVPALLVTGLLAWRVIKKIRAKETPETGKPWDRRSVLMLGLSLAVAGSLPLGHYLSDTAISHILEKQHIKTEIEADTEAVKFTKDPDAHISALEKMKRFYDLLEKIVRGPYPGKKSDRSGEQRHTALRIENLKRIKHEMETTGFSR